MQRGVCAHEKTDSRGGGGETRTQIKHKSIFWVNHQHTFIRTVQHPLFSLQP